MQKYKKAKRRKRKMKLTAYNVFQAIIAVALIVAMIGYLRI